MKKETRVGIFTLGALVIFFYLSINIGAIRIDRDQYNTYKAFFDDTGGLDVKALVKIAGVEVGWVDSIVLLEGGNAEINMMINKKNRLARNSYAIIGQEGLIGTKTLEVDSGDPSTGYLSAGSVLTMPGRSPASVGDLLDQFRDIAGSIHDIAHSFRNVFASKSGEEDMRRAVRGLANASDKLASFSQVLEKSVKTNEQNINAILTHLGATSQELKKSVPILTNDLHANLFPSMQHAADILSSNTLPTVSSMSKDLGGAGKEAATMMKKINDGDGLIGKLITEDETYGDLKKSLRGFRHFIDKTTGLGIYLDMHTETMLKKNCSKGYLDIKLRPTHDYFYQLQLVQDENGIIQRDVIRKQYRDAQGNNLNVDDLVDNSRDKIRFAEEIAVTSQRKNSMLFGFQFGKRFNHLALRVGIFENSFGFAADYCVPIDTDKMHWISSIEAFDFKGVNRIQDTRPHLKWINRAFFLRNLYTTFGIDDFFSKRHASFFIGAGLRFGDNDLKYFLSALPLGLLCQRA